jgi:hypothetical protein
VSPHPIYVLYAEDRPLPEELGEVIDTRSLILDCRRIAPGWIELVRDGEPWTAKAGHTLVAAAWETWVAIYEVPYKNRKAAFYSRLQIRLPPALGPSLQPEISDYVVAE